MRRKPLSAMLRRHLVFPVQSTEPQLARRIGINTRTLKALLEGKSRPNAKTQKILSEFLQMPIHEIFRRPGWRVKVKRVTKNSDQARILTASYIEEIELQRLADFGRAHGVKEFVATTEELSMEVNRNILLVQEGRGDIATIVNRTDQLDREMGRFVNRLPSRPPLIVCCPTSRSRPRCHKRSFEMIQAIVLGIIRSGWSCVVVKPPLTVRAHVFACWEKQGDLPKVSNCIRCKGASEYLFDLCGSSGAMPSQGPWSKLLLQERLRKLPPFRNEIATVGDAAQCLHTSNVINAYSVLHSLMAAKPYFLGARASLHSDECIELFFKFWNDHLVSLDALMLCSTFRTTKGFQSLFISADRVNEGFVIAMSMSCLQAIVERSEVGPSAKILLDAFANLSSEVP